VRIQNDTFMHEAVGAIEALWAAVEDWATLAVLLKTDATTAR
jgi:hypothetical protein